jgi:cold shock protein
MRGTVKWFSNAKGFGFLVPEGGGKDIFVHHSAIEMEGYRSLVQGELVEFETEQGPSGRLQACKVKRISRKP